MKTITYESAMAAAQDAGNRSMKAAGRKAWGKADYRAAVETFNELWPVTDAEAGAARAQMKVAGENKHS